MYVKKTSLMITPKQNKKSALKSDTFRQLFRLVDVHLQDFHENFVRNRHFDSHYNCKPFEHRRTHMKGCYPRIHEQCEKVEWRMHSRLMAFLTIILCVWEFTCVWLFSICRIVHITCLSLFRPQLLELPLLSTWYTRVWGYLSPPVVSWRLCQQDLYQCSSFPTLPLATSTNTQVHRIQNQLRVSKAMYVWKKIKQLICTPQPLAAKGIVMSMIGRQTGGWTNGRVGWQTVIWNW